MTVLQHSRAGLPPVRQWNFQPEAQDRLSGPAVTGFFGIGTA
jgi:hypothetical protein